MFPVMKETPAGAGRNEVYIMETGLSIAQMQRGMDVEGFYLLKAAFSKVTASGKPFLSAVLADTSGTIEAKVWDYSGPIGERDTGKVLKVRGSVSDYRGMPQLTVDRLRLAEESDPVDVSRLVSVAQEVQMRMTVWVSSNFSVKPIATCRSSSLIFLFSSTTKIWFVGFSQKRR